MATEGQWPKTDGDILYASEANLISPIQQIYTGNGFDTSATGSGSAVTGADDHEMTAIAAAKLVAATYVVISITAVGQAATGAGDAANTFAQVKIQSKETGGAYADTMGYKDFVAVIDAAPGDYAPRIAHTMVWVHTLTGGEITNGVQIKVFSYSSAKTNNLVSSLTNIQTVISLK